MATKDVVTKVWIEEGCIVCDACETTAPDVFEVLEDTCIIRPAALRPDFTKARTDSIVDAAEECPVDVIKFETVSEEVPDDAPAPAPAAAPAEPAEPAKAAASKAPDAPAAAKAEPAKAAAAKAPVAHASMAGDPDPAIAALLKAATARGGNAGILRAGDVGARGGKEAARSGDLPPEARQAKVQAAAKKASHELKEGRRAFVGSGFLALGWVAFGAGTGLMVGPAFGRFMMPNVLEEPDPRVRVGKLTKYIEMPVGGVNEDYKPQGIWMIRLEGRIAALSTICTHLGCIPNWLPNEHKFKCPCHGSGYYQNGINFEGPTPRPLERFKLYVNNGLVIVDKSKKYQQELGQWDMPGSFIEV